MLPKTLVVPTDFSRGSDAALTYAIELAKQLGARIVVMHAYELPMMAFPEGALVATAEIMDRMREDAERALDVAKAKVTAHGVGVSSVLKQGTPWRMVLDAVDENGAGLVVMGTHGRHGLPRALLGSVAEKVVRMAKCPVLTVHAPPPEAT